MSWAVAQVKSQCEQQAAMNLTESGFQCFYPQLKVQAKRLVLIKPMFPGYIFVEVNPDQTPRWRSIGSHRGVYRLLMSSADRPSLLPNGWVEGMIQRGAITEMFDDVVSYTKDQLVEFQAGPLAGQAGRVQWTNNQRVALLTSLLGREILVYSTLNMLKPIEVAETSSSAAAIDGSI